MRNQVAARKPETKILHARSERVRLVSVPSRLGFFANLAANGRELERIVETGPGVRKVRLEYAFEWLKAGWRLMKLHYGILLGTSLATLACNFVAMPFERTFGGAGPYVGAVVSAVFLTLTGAGALLIAHDLVETGKTEFGRLIQPFTDSALVAKLAPFVAANIALGLLNLVVTKGIRDGDTMVWTTGNTLAIALNVAVMFLFSFTAPQILFLGRPFHATIIHNLAAVRKNFLPLLAYGLLFMTMLAVSLAALVLPLFFVALPIMITQHYVLFASIFGERSPREIAPSAEIQKAF